MKVNQPVTQREYELCEDDALMSTTDTQSHLTYANESFVKVSGFDREELIGMPHNLVRHPDMPAQAFEDMWETIKNGDAWSALVKNRRKDGDHYWVRANATPVRQNGQLKGYLSVRTKPTPEEIASADKLYTQFRDKRAGSRAFYKGLIVRTGLMRWASLSKTMPVRWRIRAAFVSCAALFLLVAVLVGVQGSSLAILGSTGVVVAALACAWLERQVASPLGKLLSQALSVAAGSPEQTTDLNRVDEIGMILRAINQAGLTLQSLVDDVGAQVAGVKNASADIAQGSQDLSQRTEEQAASQEKISTAMEEFSLTAKQNSDAAEQARQLAGQASDAATSGGTVVAKVVGTMHSIGESSTKIANIIGLINDISFQTNVLALNAAVEAARAGEQGRGFAVVASEVRTLADRSANAARQIETLIGNTVGTIEVGSKQAVDAGKSMEEIVSQVTSVRDLVSEISSAGAEQAQGIVEMGEAINQIDDTGQQNVALVEESAAAAESLKRQAARLAEAVGVFKPFTD